MISLLQQTYDVSSDVAPDSVFQSHLVVSAKAMYKCKENVQRA